MEKLGGNVCELCYWNDFVNNRDMGNKVTVFTESQIEDYQVHNLVIKYYFE